MAGGGDDKTLRGIVRGEGGVVTVDSSARWGVSSCSRGKMQGHVCLDFERGAEFDGSDGGTWGGFRGRIGQTQLGKKGGDADGLLGPIDKFGLGNFVDEGERNFCVVGIGRGEVMPRKGDAAREGAPPPGTAKVAPRLGKTGGMPLGEAPKIVHKLSSVQSDSLKAALKDLTDARKMLDPLGR